MDEITERIARLGRVHAADHDVIRPILHRLLRESESETVKPFESVERIVVKALAAQDAFTSDQRSALGYRAPVQPKEPDSGEVTREILEAVAGQLDRQTRVMYHQVAHWLRSQTGETE